MADNKGSDKATTGAEATDPTATAAMAALQVSGDGGGGGPPLAATEDVASLAELCFSVTQFGGAPTQSL